MCMCTYFNFQFFICILIQFILLLTMSKLTPKEKMEIETVKLIKTVTEIDEDEENFEICERFCLSNLFFHKFLDPDENKIERTVAGLEQKFRVHAQPEKANSFRSLIEKYKQQG